MSALVFERLLEGFHRRAVMYTLFGICLLVAVAVLSTKEQRKGAWLLAAVVVILVVIADRNHWIALPW